MADDDRAMVGGGGGDAEPDDLQRGVDAEVANSLGVHAVAEAVADSDSLDADGEQEIVAEDPQYIAEEIVSDKHV